jgi:WD40 repeat protein
MYLPFPFSLIRNSLCCNLGYRMEYIQRTLPKTRKELFNKNKTDGWGVGLNIQCITAYAAELGVCVRPFVRVHALNINSGMYVKSPKKPAAKPLSTRPYPLKTISALARWEQDFLIDANFNDIVNPDVILLFEVLDDKPSLSMKADSNEAGAKRIAWGFVVPIGGSNSLNVGILDDWKSVDNSKKKIEGIRGGKDKNNKSRRKKGLLRSDDSDNSAGDDDDEEDGIMNSDKKNNLSLLGYNVDKTLRIKFYAYTGSDTIACAIQRKTMSWPPRTRNSASYNHEDTSYPDSVPEVYIQWRKQRRVELNNACLSVSIGPRRMEQIAISVAVPDGVMASPARRESMHMQLDDGSNNISGNKEELVKLRTAIMGRARAPKEICMIPNRLLNRLEVGPDGAMVVSFSHCGHLLAIAARIETVATPFTNMFPQIASPSYIYSLQLFDTDIGEKIWASSIAHHGVIYDIKWSKDDSYILTCSSDGTCKIWDVVCYRINNKGGKRTSITHPVEKRASFVDTESGNAMPTVNQPFLAHTLSSLPPVFVYSAIFQEYFKPDLNKRGPDSPRNNLNTANDNPLFERAPLPKIISGSSDGCIRVWEKNKMIGYISQDIEDGNFPAHDGRVNCLAIDERSKYLLSADSSGDINVWRVDNKGWYQFLRKFKKDLLNPQASLGNPLENNNVSGFVSLSLHPDKNKGQMLAMSTNPSQLRIYNMHTYRLSTVCNGVGNAFGGDGSGKSGFSRAQLSADGSFAISSTSIDTDTCRNVIKIWDMQTGQSVASPLTNIVFPYPVRSISWHPKQHMIAVSMVGEGAAVSIYYAQRETAEKAVARLNNIAVAEAISSAMAPNTNEENNLSTPEKEKKNASVNSSPAAISGLTENEKELKAEKTR